MLRSSHDACGCSTQTTSTINLKRSTLHPHEGQADRPNTPSDSVNPGSNPGPSARQSGLRGIISRCVRTSQSLRVHRSFDRVHADHLRRILAKYAIYYNEMRTHVSLGKDAPWTRPIERFGDVVAHPILGGLHHRYTRI